MPDLHGDYRVLSSEFRVSEKNGDRALILRAAERVGGVAAFSLRNGASSGVHAGTDRRANLVTFANSLDIEPARVFFPRQVHGNRVEILESARRPGEADAVITPISGLFLAVHTADCVPVLLLDTKSRIAAAVHAGWRGTLLRITRKTVGIMCDEFGCDPAGILAAVGPSIGPCCYEVGDEVVEAFQKALPYTDEFILKGLEASAAVDSGLRLPGGNLLHPEPVGGLQPERISRRLDLTAANRAELLDAGVPAVNVHVVGLCTACYPELFYSYRRDRRQAGRHMAITGFRA
ncbi:MAG: peptidoglycan editing factor PgeF [Desulfomonile sp.]|nr:peptidoglycan editing factor PgeF [Desulfomonile sp.]